MLPMTTFAAHPIQPDALRTVSIRGVHLHAITQRQCIDTIIRRSREGKGGWVVTPNLDHLRRLTRDRQTAELCSGATLMVADGMPLIWASRIQGTPLPERVAGSDLISTLSAAAAAHDRSIFLLGGAGDTSVRAAAVLRQRHPNIRIVGIDSPPIGFEKNPAELARISAMLQEAAPDIVFVALGSPKQEQLIASLRPKMPATWWLGIGISFSFLCGEVKRAPRWVQHLGLEWVHRLVQEPRRLARRYLVECIPFGIQLLCGSIYMRLTGAREGKV